MDANKAKELAEAVRDVLSKHVPFIGGDGTFRCSCGWKLSHETDPKYWPEHILALDLSPLVAEASKGDAPFNQRMWDLLRYQRQELHAAELITDDEYTELAKDHAAVKRLEDYDAAIARAKSAATPPIQETEAEQAPVKK